MKKGLFGYDVETVKNEINDIKQQYEIEKDELLKKIAQLEKQLLAQQAENQQLKEDEDVAIDVLVMAQKEAEDIKNKAKQDACSITDTRDIVLPGTDNIDVSGLLHNDFQNDKIDSLDEIATNFSKGSNVEKIMEEIIENNK